MVGIPAKSNAESGMTPNGVPGRSRTPSERSDAGISIVQEVFGFVKENPVRSAAKEDAASGERGAGKGAAALVHASAHSGPEREQCSEPPRAVLGITPLPPLAAPAAPAQTQPTFFTLTGPA
jgi:hypothetical protein